MQYSEVLKWITQDFAYPVPREYLDFLQKGDFVSTARLYYIVDRESETVLEISEWFTYENICSVHSNCCEERMIEKYHLPIFDSCGCTVVIDCNPDGRTYGQIFMRTPVGYYDDVLGGNVYLEFEHVADSFAGIMTQLHTIEELEDMGL